MTPEAETYLAELNGAAPDMGALAKLGVPLAEAMDICTARFKPIEPLPEPVVEPAPEAPKLNLAMYMPPVPRSTAHREPVHELSALSLLHTLSQMIDSGRADITLLVQQGFSPHTAEELTTLIHSAHPWSIA